MQQTQNTFNEGLNMDLSDYVLRNTMMRNCRNMRLLDIDGTTFAVTNIRGTEEKFQLKQGYVPVAAEDYNGILYIVSYDFTSGLTEIGTFPSPNYSGDINTEPDVYRPLNNYQNGPFNVSLLNLTAESFVDLELQPDYDDSVNLIIVARDNPPRIVNSAFSYKDGHFEILTREEPASNQYDEETLNKETSLLITSDKIMKVEFGGVEEGGILKPGNYHYMFAYMTDDFNQTNIVAQSMTCAVTFGQSGSYKLKGGNQNDQTTKKVVLELSNLDETFRYLKVYVKYTSGTESRYEQYLELDQPYDISGATSFTFEHLGYEDITEISSDAINIDHTPIESSSAVCQSKGYLLLGGIRESTLDLSKFSDIVKTAFEPMVATKTFASRNPYQDPANVYDYLSTMHGETYPYGIVFYLTNGTYSPVFPITGQDFTPPYETSDKMKELGLIRFYDQLFHHIYYNDETFAMGLHLQIQLTSEQVAELRDKTLGFFVVRAQRRPDALAQGYLVPMYRAPITPATQYVDPYYDNEDYDEDMYRFVPALDCMAEAYAYVRRLGDPTNIEEQLVLGPTNEIDKGYMPVSIPNNWMNRARKLRMYSENYDQWAFYSGDAMLNEPEMVTRLQRDEVGVQQLFKAKFRVKGLLSSQYDQPSTNQRPTPITGMWYEFAGFADPTDGYTGSYHSAEVTYVPAETGSPIGDYISKVWFAAREDATDGTTDRSVFYYISQAFNSYFGIKVSGLTDSSPGVNNPIGVQTTTFDSYRNGKINRAGGGDDDIYSQVYRPDYDNISDEVPAAFLVNIYPRSSGQPIADPADFYTTVDNLPYRQCSRAFSWDEFDMSGIFSVEAFGGDTYIGEISVKLSQPGPEWRDPSKIDESKQSEVTHRRNIDMGMVFTMISEMSYNPNMRDVYQYDNAELEERTFFPYRDGLEVNEYRKYRYPDTMRSTVGSSETLPPKRLFNISGLSPFIKSDFFTRITHSARHVPNAFKNGYRIFQGENYRDYDASMGRIVRLVNHRNNVLVVFEHGIGVAPIEQRIQTGSDTAGGIFVQPQGVLPPNLGYYTTEIGSQHPYSVITSPGAVYGLDVEKRKIWQVTDGLHMISDDGLQSFLAANIAAVTTTRKIRSGFDLEYHEVLFHYKDDYYEWTLVFREEMGRFTGFYTMYPDFFARRANSFYSFLTNRAQLHNVGNRLIYGNLEESYVEFVVNEASQVAKVFDYLDIVSNETPPEKIELYTYDEQPEKSDVIDISKTHQYIVVRNEEDFYTGEPTIRLRDRKFVMQVPVVEDINDDEWGPGGRLRNKLVIIRVTYRTEHKAELIAVITNYRYSAS